MVNQTIAKSKEKILMVREDKKNKSYYCEECNFKYKEKKFAQKCEEWCKKYKSCNIEITKHAIK